MGEEIKNFTIKDANTGKDLLTVDGGIVTWSDNSVSSISTSEEGTTATYTDLTIDTVSSNNLIKIDGTGTINATNVLINPTIGWPDTTIIAGENIQISGKSAVLGIEIGPAARVLWHVRPEETRLVDGLVKYLIKFRAG